MFDYPIMSITDLIFYVKSIDVRKERYKDSPKYHLWNYVNLLDPSSSDRKYLDGTHQTYLVRSSMKKPLFKEFYNQCIGFKLYVDAMSRYLD